MRLPAAACSEICITPAWVIYLNLLGRQGCMVFKCFGVMVWLIDVIQSSPACLWTIKSKFLLLASKLDYVHAVLSLRMRLEKVGMNTLYET
jgi:hypothetical protein